MSEVRLTTDELAEELDASFIAGTEAALEILLESSRGLRGRLRMRHYCKHLLATARAAKPGELPVEEDV